MPTLSDMSTEDLLRGYQGTQSSGDLSSMSTEDLLRGYQKPAPQSGPNFGLPIVSNVAEIGARGIDRLARMFGATPREDQPFSTEPATLPFFGAPSATGMTQSLAQSAKSAATLPGDVYAGRVDPLSEEGIKRAADMAALIQTGGRASTRMTPKPASLTEDQVLALSSKGYKDVIGAARSVPISGNYLTQVEQGVAKHVKANGGVGPLAEGADAIYDQIKKIGGKTKEVIGGETKDVNKVQNLGDLVDLHKNLRDLGRQSGDVGYTARLAKNALDVEIDRQNPGLIANLEKLDKNWAIARTTQERAKLLNDTILSAEANGGNVGKKIQAAFQPLLKGEEEYMSPAVRQATEAVAYPGAGVRALRFAEKFRPGSVPGGALQLAIAAKTGGFGNIVAVPAAMAAGAGARVMGERIMKNRAQKMLEILRSEAPANVTAMQTSNLPAYQLLPPAPLSPLPVLTMQDYPRYPLAPPQKF